MLAFKSASFTVKNVELLGLFAMKTRNTVSCESLVGLLGLLTMKTRPKDTFTCENGLDLLDLLSMQGGRTTSTHGGRGRTNADGRGCHGLLNMGFKNLDSGKGLRGSGMGLLAPFFTFKSENTDGSEVCAWA